MPTTRKTAVKKTTAKKATAKKTVAKKKAPVKKAVVKKTTSKRVGTIEISLHLPGSMPEKLKVKADATLESVMESRNLDTGYTVFVKRGASTLNTKSTTLVKGDIIRVGVKTKNNC